MIAALLSRDECAALLLRIAGLSSRRSASRSLLAVLARLATPACTWLEGELAVELFEAADPDETGTKVRVMSEIGAGLRERVVPVVTLPQSLDDVLAGFDTRRDLTTVLRLERVSSRCALLLARRPGADRDDEEGAPMSTEFDISETSLAWPGAGHTAEDVDSGWG